MKKLLVLSGKGGTGKTTVAAALIHFSRARAIADCDVDAPNLHLTVPLPAAQERIPFFGSEKACIEADRCNGCGLCVEACRFQALHRTASGKVDVNTLVCEGCGVCTYVCPRQAAALRPDLAGCRTLYTRGSVFSTATLRMGRGNSGKLVTEVKTALAQAAPDAPLAIIDGSPGIGCPVIASVSGADLVLAVTEPTVSGLSDLQRLLHTAATLDAPIAVCVNRFDDYPEGGERIEAFCRERHIPLAGRIPTDPEVRRALNAGRSIAEVECPAQAALLEVYHAVQRLLGEETA
ncbi:MAG: ATP-binding protein [Candidatus Limiplasma sp.]|nr:ATP-binding protein [Candidatus Limiplasma sp.]